MTKSVRVDKGVKAAEDHSDLGTIMCQGRKSGVQKKVTNSKWVGILRYQGMRGCY